ncbi:MAG TPA: putative porin [Pyrinomonadaceae bacterium]|nr:putative porin [Pyrinomonadaceae bacterium]
MRQLMTSVLALSVSFFLLSSHLKGQEPLSASPANAAAAVAPPPPDAVLRQLEEQRGEIERLRAEMAEQSRRINELLKRVEKTEAFHDVQTVALSDQTARRENAQMSVERASLVTGQDAAAQQTPPRSDVESRLTKVEGQVKQASEGIAKQLGSIAISGDIRLRYESIYGQLNTSPNAGNPGVAGNELSSRQRGRFRLRLAMRGQINKEFDWGLRLATGSYADNISSNQTFTDFFNRKPFGLDQAYITYRPGAVPGLRLQGGKFEAPWISTEMLFDNDLTYEGLNESYSRDFKKSRLKNLTFAAWQLPFLENNSTFVRDADGTVDIRQSRRNGRDLALFGAQIRASFEPAAKTELTIAAADHYFSGTQFITPVQFFGSQVQLPVTVTIPASGSIPAQTITTFATIPRDQLVSGNGNLGISTATNNAVNRDGRLASGFNIVDLIARLNLTHSKKFPVTLLANFVTNTQTRDVILAGPQGTSRIVPNDENHGFWAEVQVGKTQQRGDYLFGYTFVRIEKDAVLTPFNFSDITQLSDVRAQRIVAAYALDPRIVISLTGIFTQRPHGPLGVFGATPPGSLNPTTSRYQLDTIFRF